MEPHPGHNSAIRVTVSGGMVTIVANIPRGIEVHVMDYDNGKGLDDGTNLYADECGDHYTLDVWKED